MLLGKTVTKLGLLTATPPLINLLMRDDDANLDSRNDG